MTATPDWQMLSDEQETHSVELWYPLIRKNKRVRISLYDVRAADDLVVEFDHKRNGWVLRMDLTYGHSDGGPIDIVKRDEEVAFVPAYNVAD